MAALKCPCEKEKEEKAVGCQRQEAFLNFVCWFLAERSR